MRHYTLIPKDHPQAHLLEQLTNQVIDIVNVGEAYISVDNGDPEIIFTFFIDTTYTRIDNELLLPLNRIFANYSSITYRIFSCDYAADAVRKGNLYFVRHCTLGSMIYANPSATHEVDPDGEIPGLLLPRAKKHFKRAMAKVDGRYTNFPKCLKYEKFLDGAYVLHQMMEQLFKFAESFIIGKEIFSKDMAEHQAELSRFAPSLAPLFDPADEEETRLQRLILSAYQAYRSKDRLEIERKDLEKLLFKTQWLRQEVERLFKEAVANCYEKAKIQMESEEADESDKVSHTDIENSKEEEKQKEQISYKPLLPRYMMTDDGNYTCKIQFDNYSDLFVVIEDLIEISLHTLYNSGIENSGTIKHPDQKLVSVLELVKKLLPVDAGQTLTELNDYLISKQHA